MHFLKCTRCGHFNEVKTEYLTFCSNCYKKLDHNFPDWKRQNPDKLFDDFKKIFCTTEIIDPPKKESNSKKSKGLKYGIGFALAFMAFYAIGQLGGEKIAGFFRKPAFDKAMVEIASEINKTCPVMIDNVTRLDNTIALPNNIFQYNYTIINLPKDSLNMNELKNSLEPRIINNVKTNPQMKFVRNNKVTVNYSYKDITGVNLFIISVKPGQYQ